MNSMCLNLSFFFFFFFCGCKQFFELAFFKFQIYRQVHLVFSESAVSDSTTKSIRNCLCCQATLKHGKQWVMCLDFVQENRLCQPYERNANITSCTFYFYGHFFYSACWKLGKHEQQKINGESGH